MKNSLDNIFGILCLFGIKLVIYELFEPNPEYNDTFDDLISVKMDQIKLFFLKPTIQLEEFMKTPQGLGSMWD